MKKCPKCGIVKFLCCFSKDKQSKDGLRRICKDCDRFYRKKYRCSKQGRIKEKEYRQSKAGKLSMKKRQLKYLYGITLKQHKQMYIDQYGRCAICGRFVEYEKIQTDHNHITNKVRGLLCKLCNTRLGWFEFKKDIILNYLKGDR